MGVWVDSDMGFDDLAALLTLDRAGTVEGLSLSFGCAALPRVERAAAGAAALFGWGFPIVSGADRALLGGAETAARVLGESGMPSRGAAPPDADASLPPALPALAGWLERRESAEILALGPLSNLAALVLARPDLAPRLACVTWMGGAAGAGNHTASAEFNALADPEALAVLISRGVPIRMIDLDICRRVLIGEGDVAALRAAPGPRAGALADWLGGYLDIALSRGRPAMALYDPVAAAALLAPDAFAFAPVRLDVELAGRLTRGRTVVDARPSAAFNAEIAVEVDADRVRALCLDALAASA